MAGTPPRDETVIRLHDIVFDKVMSVLRGPEAAPFDLSDDYFDRFNTEFDQPLRLSATVPTSTHLLIKSNRISSGDGGARQTPPIDDAFNLYPDTAVDFDGGSVSGSGTVTTETSDFSLPSVSAGNFVRMAAVYQSVNNAVDTTFSTAVSSVDLLDNPADLFALINGLPIGYIDLESLGVSSFASPGSTLIENAVSGEPTIFRVVGDSFTSPLTNPMDSAGDMIIGGAGGAVAKLDSGVSGTVLNNLTANSPSWELAPLAQEGWISVDLVDNDRGIPSGQTLIHPNLTLDSGVTWTVSGTLYSPGGVFGPGTLAGSGTVFS